MLRLDLQPAAVHHDGLAVDDCHVGPELFAMGEGDAGGEDFDLEIRIVLLLLHLHSEEVSTWMAMWGVQARVELC